MRIHHCGVCRSDLTVADGKVPQALPVVLGHEAAGVVEEVGEGVTDLQPGDRVVLSPCPPCGRCYYCQRGEFSICVNSMALMTGTFLDGSTRLSRGDELVYRGLALGAFAELVTVDQAGAIKVGDDVPLDVACVLGCAVQTGVGAVINTAKVEPGATVLVTGAGGIGLSIVQGAVLAGASRVIISDPVAERRQVAIDLGATDQIDPTDTDLAGAAFELTGGIGVDYAFEGAGKGALVEACIGATRFGGTTVVVGAPALEESASLDPVSFFTVTERKVMGCLLGSSNSRRDVPLLLDLWRAGRLDLEALITDRRPLGEVNEAFDDMRAARGIRTVLDV